MNKDEKGPSFIGIFKVPCYKGEAGNKALKIFNKLKRKAEQTETTSPTAQVTPLRGVEPNAEALRYSAMNSDRLHAEVVKKEGKIEAA